MNTFGSDTTTEEVLAGIDLSGRRVVITGAAGGLGRESARVMASRGALVTVAARSPQRADDAVAELRKLVPGGRFDAGVVDLGDFSSIRAFTDSVLAEQERIDVLINNAGVMACPFGPPSTASRPSSAPTTWVIFCSLPDWPRPCCGVSPRGW